MFREEPMSVRDSPLLHRLLCIVCCRSASPPRQPRPSPSGDSSTGFAGLDQYRASRIAVFTDDFGQLARYRDANAGLKPLAAGENRVVFFGDSITDIWKLEDYFPGKPYVNRGIGGPNNATDAGPLSAGCD